MILFTGIIALLIIAFYLAMNTANVYVLLSDGMKLRTSVILTREDANELSNFFTDDFLARDETLLIGLSNQSPYIDYDIVAFNHSVSLEWMWSWPWEDVAQATIVEEVPRIVGSVITEKRDQIREGGLSANPPEWYKAQYRVYLQRVNGQWKIAGLERTMIFPKPSPSPSPTPAR